jgi:hypothetical protein
LGRCAVSSCNRHATRPSEFELRIL